MSSKLMERAVLMRLSFGLPGEHRQDKDFSKTVRSEHGLAEESGNWNKHLFPKEALAPIKTVDGEAGKYHEMVTLPFDKGIRILPAKFIPEHTEKIREFRARRESVVESHFIPRYDEWVERAKTKHNGTFKPKDYPGADATRKKFYFRCEPLPVPDAEHFTEAVTQLLGVDAASVNLRVADATKEAQMDLVRRLAEPVKAIAERLAQEPKAGRTYIVSLVDNLKQIVSLAPTLNLMDDPIIAKFVEEMKPLTLATRDELRDHKDLREAVKAEAEAMLAKLEGYRL